MIRVLVGWRESIDLEAMVRSIPQFEFAGSFDNETLRSQLVADVLLMEAESYHQDFQALADLPIPVVLLIDTSDPAIIAAALRAGIRGTLSRDATPDEIEGAIHAARAGLTVTTPTALAALLPDAETWVDQPAEPLSDREREVLALLAEGLSNKLIACQLNISEHTVKTHVQSIFAKRAVSSRTEAVSLACSSEFDLILMDVQMPVLDGLGATRKIRRFEQEHGLARVPVVAYTSCAYSGNEPFLLDFGIDAVLEKPSTARTLQECLLSWLPAGRIVGNVRAAGRDAPMQRL